MVSGGHSDQLTTRKKGTTRNKKEEIITEMLSSARQFYSRLSLQKRVFVGTSAWLIFTAVTFFGFPQKKSGHNLFDVDR